MTDQILLREIHPEQEVLKARVRAERIDPQVSFEKIGRIGRFLLVGLFKKFEGFILVSHTRIDNSDHVLRDIVRFRLGLQLVKYFLRLVVARIGKR